MIVGVVVAVIVGVRGEGDQAASGADLQGVYGGEDFGWHEGAEFFEVGGLDGGDAAVFAVDVG